MEPASGFDKETLLKVVHRQFTVRVAVTVRLDRSPDLHLFTKFTKTIHIPYPRDAIKGVQYDVHYLLAV
jgi:hypothetical protein